MKARERGYVLYVEGGTDADMLRALAVRLGHPAAEIWDERINSFYVQNNYPVQTLDSELERVEGGFGITPKDHFFALRDLVPGLQGLAILDNDGLQRQGFDQGGLKQVYWRRYEAENYFITPDVLAAYAREHYADMSLFQNFQQEIDAVLSALLKERLFAGNEADFQVFQTAEAQAARLLWEAKTERLKLSDFAEEFFRRLADELGHAMLLRKGELHRLVAYVDPGRVPAEVSEKLDLLRTLFLSAPNDGLAKPI